MSLITQPEFTLLNGNKLASKLANITKVPHALVTFGREEDHYIATLDGLDRVIKDGIRRGVYPSDKAEEMMNTAREHHLSTDSAEFYQRIAAGARYLDDVDLAGNDIRFCTWCSDERDTKAPHVYCVRTTVKDEVERVTALFPSQQTLYEQLSRRIRPQDLLSAQAAVLFARALMGTLPVTDKEADALWLATLSESERQRVLQDRAVAGSYMFVRVDGLDGDPDAPHEDE